MSEVYNHHAIEKKWQEYWEEHETFKTDVWDFSKPKYYALDMFCKENGFKHSELVFVGDDYGLGGNDESVFKSDIKFLKVDNYLDFPKVVSVLL